MSENLPIGSLRETVLPVLKYRTPILRSGNGSLVRDTDGKEYLDLNSGQFCSIFGHSYPGFLKVFDEILTSIQDTDTSTISEPVIKATMKLHEISGQMSARSLLLSTGAEANECALKYAKYLKKRDGIVAFSLGYHGLTHGTAAYSLSRDRIRPRLEKSYAITTPMSFPSAINYEAEEASIIELREIIELNGKEIAAVIFEPIISGGGFYFPSKHFFQAAINLCRDNDILFILDECQTGVARTGDWFYFQRLGINPDIVVIAKALGGGFPVSAVMMNSQTINNNEFEMQYFSSHQNEPFAGHIINFVLEEIERLDLLKSNINKGEFLRNSLRDVDKDGVCISNIRGIGMMNAFNLVECEQYSSIQLGDIFVEKCLEEGLLLQHCNFGKTIRLLPNYMVSEQDIEMLVIRLKKVVKRMKGLLK